MPLTLHGDDDESLDGRNEGAVGLTGSEGAWYPILRGHKDILEEGPGERRGKCNIYTLLISYISVLKIHIFRF